MLSAMYGAVNELRLLHMRGGAISTTPRFAETARALFPALRDDADVALEVAEAMMMLHRRVERAVNEAASREPAVPPKPVRWPFRRR
jgi:hypothetical protein